VDFSDTSPYPKTMMSEDAKHKGRIFLHRGDLVQARFWYEKAVKLDREAGTSSLTESIGNLGNVCAMTGDYAEAERCYREVLAIQRKRQRDQQDLAAIGQTLVNLGNLQAEAGRPQQARPYYLEALDLLKPLQDSRSLGVLYSNLALQDAAEGRTDDAIAQFKQALEAHRSVGDEEGLAVTYSQLGKTFLVAGQLRQAEKCLNNASEHFVKLGNSAAEAAVLRQLADLYERRADHLATLRCLERIMVVTTRSGLEEREDAERIARLRVAMRREVKSSKLKGNS
jgi:tetratricopeptide (TPR) repeat protein